MLHVFLTDVCDCYVLVADGFCLLFFFLFLFSLFLTSVVILIFLFFRSFVRSFVPYTLNDLSHRRPALMALTFPADYHNRNVIF